MRLVDTTISQTLHQLIEGTLFMILKVVSVAIVLPLFVIPAVVTFALGGWLSVLYMHAQLSVKREMSNAQAPVLGHFGGAIAGLGMCSLEGDIFVSLSVHSVDHGVWRARGIHERVLQTNRSLQSDRTDLHCFDTVSGRSISRLSDARIEWENAARRWVSVRVNLLGVSLTTALAVYLTYVAPVGASNTGFSLSMASKLTFTIS